jgi:hypothetical protein
LVRSLLWIFVDFAPWFAASPGIVASLMNKQGKRIGDMVAGTVVIRERHQPMASPPLFVPGHLVQWAQSLELSRLSDDLANTSREYLARYKELEPAARVALGDALAFKVGGLTAPAPPVPISSPAFLSAVLAERRRRELDRLGAHRVPTGPFSAPSPYAQQLSPYGGQPAFGGGSGGMPPYGGGTGGVPPYGGQPGATPAYGGPHPPPGTAVPPGPPPPPPQPRPAGEQVNPEGWHAPGSGQSSQWF